MTEEPDDLQQLTDAQLLELLFGPADAAPMPAFSHPDGRVVFIYPLTFGRARLCVGPPGAATLDDEW